MLGVVDEKGSGTFESLEDLQKISNFRIYLMILERVIEINMSET